jgi:hypothetical protein
MVTILALLVIAVLVAGGVALAGMLGRDADGGAVGSPTSPAATGPATGDPAPTPSPAPTSTSARATPSATASSSATPQATPSATATAGPASDTCDSAAVTVAAETDKQSYGPSENPVLSLVVRNGGTAPCTVNVGTSQMEFVLTSADERVFSSTDCQQASQDLERTIEPGDEERATFEWSRDASVPGCTLVDEVPGAGSYTLTTRLGARSSTPVEFELR